MTKIEYKLFKTKSKLSSLLSTVITNSPQNSESFQTSPDSFYILIELKSGVNNGINDKNDDEEFDSIWFNRSSGQVTLKKSNYSKSYLLSYMNFDLLQKIIMIRFRFLLILS